MKKWPRSEKSIVFHLNNLNLLGSFRKIINDIRLCIPAQIGVVRIVEP